jgi:hypothetical protein
VGRGVGRAPGWDSGPDVDPPAVRGGVTTADGVAVALGTPLVGVGSIVGLGLAGALLGVAVAAGVADGDAAAGVGEAGDTGALAAGEAPPVSGGIDGRTAVSPPSDGEGEDAPNAPTASAIAARRRFRIPRATTSRARWAIVTNDRDSSSGRGTRRLKETASRFRSYNAKTANRVSR